MHNHGFCYKTILQALTLVKNLYVSHEYCNRKRQEKRSYCKGIEGKECKIKSARKKNSAVRNKEKIKERGRKIEALSYTQSKIREFDGEKERKEKHQSYAENES